MKKILLYLFTFLLVFIESVSDWADSYFGDVNFSEILFQLRSPLAATESSVMNAFFLKSLLPSIIISLIVFFLFSLLFEYIKDDNKRILKIVVIVFIIVFSIFDVVHALNKFDFFKYVSLQTTKSSYIENNYVDPKSVSIKFPEKKKNLIYIYVESYESSYFSKELGGVKEDNLLEPITQLTKNNINFSNSDKFGGARDVSETNWTTAAMTAQSTGLPLKLRLDNSDMLEEYTSIGDILHDNGYYNEFIMGSDASFGYRDLLLEGEAYDKILDYNEMIDMGYISADYKEWWGVEDKKVFEIAKSELDKLSEKDNFNLQLLTSNTHVQDGYLDKSCPTKFEDKYSNSIYCTATEINEFIEWLKTTDYYDDTVIVITGDHITMQNNYFEENDSRTIYNLFINTKSTFYNTNRDFSTMDMFPTTLSAMNVKIEGDRLGLGTDLFSGRETLIEKDGYDKFNDSMSNYSKFYYEKMR